MRLPTKLTNTLQCNTEFSYYFVFG